MTYISMSQKDLNKYDVIKEAIRKEITVKKAGELLRLCERQIYRLKRAVKRRGAAALIHANQGKPGNRRMPDAERQQIIDILSRRYPDFKPTHASEKLNEIHGIKRDPVTIRQIMTGAGVLETQEAEEAGLPQAQT